jgi:hypothetical protein
MGLLEMAAAKTGDTLLPAITSAVSAAISNTIAYGPEAGIKAGVFAAAFTLAGDIPGALSPQRIMAHALLGCLQQATSGGQCGPGAAAAAFGKIATGMAGQAGINSGPAQFAITTVVGGTASVIGGGKFANGAAQAAFGYLFNNLTELVNRGGDWRSQKGYHFYSETSEICQTSQAGCTVERVSRALRECPTPAACTEGGVKSGASVWINGNRVSVVTGDTWILNRTEFPHAFSDGYVLRMVVDEAGTISVRSYGEGVNRNTPARDLNLWWVEKNKGWQAADTRIRAKTLSGGF